MHNLQKKPLTHRVCIKSNHTFWKIVISIILIAILIVPIAIFLDGGDLSNGDIGGLICGVLFGGLFAVFGAILLINAIKDRTKLMARKYYIYMDIVVSKKVQKDDDSVSYLLCFANNKYTKAVSKKKYEATQAGTPYYLLQINDAKKAINAFAESEYYLDESVRRNFRAF